MSTVPPVVSNAFNNYQTFLGRLALAINNSRVLAGKWNGAGTATVGDRVLLDSTVQQAGVCKFLPCADNVPAFGVIIGTVREDTINPGDDIEVAFVGGQAMTQIAGATLTPGTPVARNAGFLAPVDGTHVQMGLLIDYVTDSNPGRVILGWSPS